MKLNALELLILEQLEWRNTLAKIQALPDIEEAQNQEPPKKIKKPRTERTK